MFSCSGDLNKLFLVGRSCRFGSIQWASLLSASFQKKRSQPEKKFFLCSHAAAIRMDYAGLAGTMQLSSGSAPAPGAADRRPRRLACMGPSSPTNEQNWRSPE
jgi:hypothetical protein